MDERNEIIVEGGGGTGRIEIGSDASIFISILFF